MLATAGKLGVEKSKEKMTLVSKLGLRAQAAFALFLINLGSVWIIFPLLRKNLVLGEKCIIAGQYLYTPSIPGLRIKFCHENPKREKSIIVPELGLNLPFFPVRPSLCDP